MFEQFFTFMDSRAIQTYLFDSIMEFIDLLEKHKSDTSRVKHTTSEFNIFGVSIIHESFLVTSV